MAAENSFASGGAVNRGVGDFTEQLGQGTGMVGLVVLHHYGVDLVQRKLLLQARHELAVVGTPHRIEQNSLAMPAEKVSIVAGTASGAELVAVEGCEFPVGLADPGNVVCNLLCHISTKIIISGELCL